MTAAKTKDQHAANVQKYLHQAELALRIGNGLLISELLWNATEQALKVFGEARGLPSDTVEDRWRIADILDQEDGNDLSAFILASCLWPSIWRRICACTCWTTKSRRSAILR